MPYTRVDAGLPSHVNIWTLTCRTHQHAVRDLSLRLTLHGQGAKVYRCGLARSTMAGIFIFNVVQNRGRGLVTPPAAARHVGALCVLGGQQIAVKRAVVRIVAAVGVDVGRRQHQVLVIGYSRLRVAPRRCSNLPEGCLHAMQGACVRAICLDQHGELFNLPLSPHPSPCKVPCTAHLSACSDTVTPL